MTFQKGNKFGGRPKSEFTLSDQLRKALKRKHYKEGVKRGFTNAQLIAEKVVEKSKEGEAWAANLVWDRIEGKAAQQIELSSGQKSIKVDLGEEITSKLADIYTVTTKSEDK